MTMVKVRKHQRTFTDPESGVPLTERIFLGRINSSINDIASVANSMKTKQFRDSIIRAKFLARESKELLRALKEFQKR